MEGTLHLFGHARWCQSPLQSLLGVKNAFVWHGQAGLARRALHRHRVMEICQHPAPAKQAALN